MLLEQSQRELRRELLKWRRVRLGWSEQDVLAEWLRRELLN